MRALTVLVFLACRPGAAPQHARRHERARGRLCAAQTVFQLLCASVSHTIHDLISVVFIIFVTLWSAAQLLYTASYRRSHVTLTLCTVSCRRSHVTLTLCTVSYRKKPRRSDFFLRTRPPVGESRAALIILNLGSPQTALPASTFFCPSLDCWWQHVRAAVLMTIWYHGQLVRDGYEFPRQHGNGANYFRLEKTGCFD